MSKLYLSKFTVLLLVIMLLTIILSSCDNMSDREKQKLTVDRMDRLTMAVEQYIMDHGKAPDVSSLTDLRALLVKDNNIADIDDNFLDAWGNPFKYWKITYNDNDKDYSLKSLGSDNKEDNLAAMGGIVTHPDQDIVVINGRFVQRPE